MSQLFVDNIKNRTGGAIGAPSGAVVTGIVTATTFDGNITGVAATFTGNVTVGGVLTYEDVTNIDSVGLITARSGIKFGVSGVGGTITATGQAEFAGVCTAASFSGAFSGDLSIDDKIIHTGDTNTAIRFPAADTFSVETAGSERVRVDSSGRTLINTSSSIATEPDVQGYTPALQVVHAPLNAGTNGVSINRFQAGNAFAPPLIFQKSKNDTIGSHTIVADNDELGDISFAGSDGAAFRTAARINVDVDGTPGSSDMPGRIQFSTTANGAATPTERLRIDSRGSILFKNGLLTETVKINTTARTGTQAVNLNDGNVHFFTTASSATWKPNFTMSTTPDINDTISTGESFSVTMMVAKGATSHFANSAEVDGTTIGTIEFLGGAPTDGGGSGTYDVYSYTIIKTGDNAFFAFASVSKYE